MAEASGADVRNLRAQLEQIELQRRELHTKLSAWGDPVQVAGLGPVGQTAAPSPLAADPYIIHGIYVGPRPMTAEQQLEVYRRALASRVRVVPLRGFDPRLGTAPRQGAQVSQVYIPLDTDLLAPAEAIAKALADLGKGGKGTILPPELVTGREPGQGAVRAVTALEAVMLRRSQTLLGGPGAGKTTLVNYLIHALATRDGAVIKGWREAEQGLEPILVMLRDLAAWLDGPGAGRKPNADLLLEFIRHDLAERNLVFAADALEEVLGQGRTFTFFDGLDEVPAPALPMVRASIEAFAKRFAGGRFLVTCRPLAYRHPRSRLPDGQFPTLTLTPFDSERVERFIQGWYAQGCIGVRCPGMDPQAALDMLRQTVRRPDLWHLATNPMMLTLMALVHSFRGELPEARSRLYEDAVDVLLWRWEQYTTGDTAHLTDQLREARRDRGDLMSLLERLAYRVQGKGSTDAILTLRGDAVGQTASVAGIGEAELLEALAGLHPRRNAEWAQGAIDTIKVHVPLLVEDQPGVFTFAHRTIQEYLAGAYLAHAGDFPDRVAALVDERGYWREPILLGVGFLVHNQRETERPLRLVDRLCPTDFPTDDDGWRRVWVAGETISAIGMMRVSDTPQGVSLLDRVRHRLAALVEHGALHPGERAAAAEVLGRLGDARFEPQGYHLPARHLGEKERALGMVLVRSGPFVMGSREGDKAAYDEELGNSSRTGIEYNYWIGRYPVTVAQYRAFVKARGYDRPDWWTRSGWAWIQTTRRDAPTWWAHQRAFANRPVVGVTWYEAMAYARWLQHQLHKRKLPIPPGYQVRLPTEAEWEKAARGTDARAYPWGNEWQEDRASLLRATGGPAPVGLFPAGASPCRALDMCGNVREWCLSLGRAYPYMPDDELNDPDSPGPRVLRGGAYDDGLRRGRCAAREWGAPDRFGDAIGFRLAMSLMDDPI